MIRIREATSLMIIAVRLVLASSTSISVFPLTITRPRPVRYASRMLEKNDEVRKKTAKQQIGYQNHISGHRLDVI